MNKQGLHYHWDVLEFLWDFFFLMRGRGLPWQSSGEESTCQRDMGSIPDAGRSHMLWGN